MTLVKTMRRQLLVTVSILKLEATPATPDSESLAKDWIKGSSVPQR